MRGGSWRRNWRRGVRQLQGFLEQVLGFDPETADREACRLEHQVDDELARRIGLLNDAVGADAKLRQALHARMKG